MLSAGILNLDGSVTLTPDQLAGLTVTPPEDSTDDFTLIVTATSTDGSDTASTTALLPGTCLAIHRLTCGVSKRTAETGPQPKTISMARNMPASIRATGMIGSRRRRVSRKIW